jgi:hypothetical protein
MDINILVLNPCQWPYQRVGFHERPGQVTGGYRVHIGPGNVRRGEHGRLCQKQARVVVKSRQAPWQKRHAPWQKRHARGKIEAGPVAKAAGPVQKGQAPWQKGRPRGKRGRPYAEKAGPVQKRQAPSTWQKGRPQESAMFLGKGGRGSEAVVVLVLVLVVLEILEVDMIPNIKSKLYRSPTGNLKPPPWVTVREESPSKHCSWRRRTAPHHLSFASVSPRKGPPSPSRKTHPNGRPDDRRCPQRCGRS